MNRGLVLLALVAVGGCMNQGFNRAPAPDYRPYDRWDIASLVMDGQSVDVSGVAVRDFQPPNGADRMQLAVKGCETLRFVWQLINPSPGESALRTTEAVSTRGDCDAASDTALRTHLRRVNQVRFEFERIELVSPTGRLVLQPS